MPAALPLEFRHEIRRSDIKRDAGGERQSELREHPELLRQQRPGKRRQCERRTRRERSAS